MDLNTLWFLLIAVLYIGFFVLEGFDFGVGILLPFLGKTDAARRVMINTIGPHWDGNEVWLITAGGATFAAFPNWYATLFSGFYLPLLIILLALIVRGVAFEFRSKDDDPRWRSLWDWSIFVSSFIPALLFGVAFTNFVRGVPLDASMNYVGGFFNLLNPYALLGGVVSLLGFTLHGAIFLSLKTPEVLSDQAQDIAARLWLPTLAVMVVYAIATYFTVDVTNKLGVNPGLIPMGGILSMLIAGYFITRRQSGWAFMLTSLSIIFSVASVFVTLFPNVLVSNPNPEYSLTIYNAASSPYTLTVMSIIALIFLPFVLGYQVWAYWVFRHRVSGKVEELHY
jgi:cytochrome d ubiquinol oxidase subunit II